MRKTVLSYANNKCADQPVHPRSLISAFVVRCVDSMIPMLAKTISCFMQKDKTGYRHISGLQCSSSIFAVWTGPDRCMQTETPIVL